VTNLPSGTVTFLFTDIEGSTRLWQEQPEAMSIAHARHDTILREAIESNHGYVFQIVGDSFSAAFHNAIDGLHAALAAQRGLARMNENTDNINPSFSIHPSALALKVRMGLHTGAAEIDGENKYSEGYTTIASTQRVMSVAHGGQVLFSHTTYDLLQNDLPENISLRDMGEHQLKSLRAPLRLYQLSAPDLPQDFPAIQSLHALPNNLPIQLTSFVGREHACRFKLPKNNSLHSKTAFGSLSWRHSPMRLTFFQPLHPRSACARCRACRSTPSSAIICATSNCS